MDQFEYSGKVKEDEGALHSTVVFIMGPGHCGSTLLDLILGSHSGATSLGEFHRVSRILDAGSGARSPICGVCHGRCEFWNDRVSQRHLRAYYSRKTLLYRVVGRVLRHFENPYAMLLRASGSSVIIDSSKQPYWIGKQLQPAHVWKKIRPALIFLGRDGRAVVNSYFRKYPERGISAITRNWVDQIREMESFYANFSSGPKTRLLYEEFAEKPEEVIPALCDWLGLEYEPQMLLYWTHDHHHLFGNGGTRALIFRYREQLGSRSDTFRKRVQQARQHFPAEYYDQVHYGIHLDERWRTELTPEQLLEFSETADHVNVQFERVEAGS